jgi:hypothetical protein
MTPRQPIISLSFYASATLSAMPPMLPYRRRHDIAEIHIELPLRQPRFQRLITPGCQLRFH